MVFFTCPKCQAPNVEGSPFCANCGERLKKASTTTRALLFALSTVLCLVVGLPAALLASCNTSNFNGSAKPLDSTGYGLYALSAALILSTVLTLIWLCASPRRRRVMPCQSCGAWNDANNRQCGHCGAPLHPSKT